MRAVVRVFLILPTKCIWKSLTHFVRERPNFDINVDDIKALKVDKKMFNLVYYFRGRSSRVRPFFLK